MIHKALGEDDVAHDELTTALAINPRFDPIDVGVATAALAELGPR